MKRFGAPYFGIHRADLQKILSGAFGTENVHLGCRLVNIVEQSDSVVLEFANGRTEHADLVVGADGVRSTVRRLITGADDAIYSGTSAFRGIVPVENLPSLPDPQAIQFWMGPDAHLLHYAIGGSGDAVNFFAVVEDPKIWMNEGSVVEVGDEVPVASFRGWHPAVTEMIRAAASPIRWALFRVRPLLRWYRAGSSSSGTPRTGCCRITGKARTPRSRTPSRWRRCSPRPRRTTSRPLLSRYQSLRRARTRKIQRSSWVTNHLLHLLPGPAVQKRVTPRWPGRAGLRLDPRVRRAGGAAEDRGHAGSYPGRTQVGSAGTHGAGRGARRDRRGFFSVAGIDPAEVTLEKSFDDLGVDSMTMVEAVVALEDRIGVLIPDDEWARFSTVGDLAAHLEQVGAGAR